MAVLPATGHDEVTALKLAATLEKGSEHPLAEAIVRGAEDRGVTLAEAADFGAVTGPGGQRHSRRQGRRDRQPEAVRGESRAPAALAGAEQRS